MSVLNKSAAAMTNNVAGLAFIQATDSKALRAGVSAGLKQSLRRSAGMDSAPGMTLNAG